MKEWCMFMITYTIYKFNDSIEYVLENDIIGITNREIVELMKEAGYQPDVVGVYKTFGLAKERLEQIIRALDGDIWTAPCNDLNDGIELPYITDYSTYNDVISYVIVGEKQTT